MKLLPSDPDIETIVARIKKGDLDLQPDFQRGEVWPDSKKRGLIDTVLRDWHIPPIHVIERPTSHKQEVLDGQQRLVAIRDFVNGVIRVDGHIQPIENEILAAHNCTYETLPADLRRRFDRFTIRIFRLVDFKPDEPGELFFRLNQPASLTAAEQRNAFFGPVRNQIRQICEEFPAFGLNNEVLGFSNSRMAFDDIVAKLCLACERGSLRQKITAATITDRYRTTNPVDGKSINKVRQSLWIFGLCLKATETKFKHNKATLFSWLAFFSRGYFEDHHTEILGHTSHFFLLFEQFRSEVGRPHALAGDRAFFPSEILLNFTDRASLRVGDVSSVIIRDAVLAYCFAAYLKFVKKDHLVNDDPIFDVYRAWLPILRYPTVEPVLLSKLEEIHWGSLQ